VSNEEVDGCDDAQGNDGVGHVIGTSNYSGTESCW
jgi:hypothetical protein